MSKETIKALRGLMIFAALLVLAVLHLDKVFLALGLIISIFRPFIIGAAVAFVINLPMKAIENRLFAKRNKLSKWKRPLSFVLSILAVVLVFWAVFMLIIPQLGETISELAVKIPAFLGEAVKVLQEVFDNNPQIQEYIAGLDIAAWDWDSIISKAANALGSGIGSVLMSTVSVAGSIFGVVFDMVVAFVFAVYLLMQKDILSNVTLPLRLAGVGKKQRIEKGMEMLRIVGLEEKAKAYPSMLSGGQKQRVAIARALAMNPKVLLCDEATSALDPKITNEILKLLKEINRTMNITIVIITHEMSVIESICDRVAIVDNGKVEEIGAVKEIFSKPKSSAAKKLVLPAIGKDNPYHMTDKKCYRIVFAGRAADEPVIANLGKTTGESLNILSANTRSVGGIGFGQMIVELPKEEDRQKTILDYFKSIDMSVMEVKEEVSE